MRSVFLLLRKFTASTMSLFRLPWWMWLLWATTLLLLGLPVVEGCLCFGPDYGYPVPISIAHERPDDSWNAVWHSLHWSHLVFDVVWLTVTVPLASLVWRRGRWWMWSLLLGWLGLNALAALPYG